MDERAQKIQDAITEIAQIDDPETQARAATQALEVLSAGNGVLSRARRQAILKLRAAGLSYRKIGEAVGIHFTRVRTIENEQPVSNSARRRAAKRAQETGAAPAEGAEADA